MSALDHRNQEEPFVELFLHQIRPRLKSLFARYRIPPQDTEDILQAALLALVYQWPGIRDPEAWLMGTLKNRCLLYWRERRRKLYEGVDSTVLDLLAQPCAPEQEHADLVRDLSAVIGRLPERCQSLLRLRYQLGYEASEVAERLGYSPTSMSKVTTRCLAALLRQLTAAGLSQKNTRKKSQPSRPHPQEEVGGEDREDRARAPYGDGGGEGPRLAELGEEGVDHEEDHPQDD